MPKATLGGCSLLASRSVSWTLTPGVFPHTGLFDVMPSDAIKLLGKTTPVKLEIEGALTVSNLWVVGEAPSDCPALRTMIVVDRRWFWPYAHVYRRFNMRKRIGVKRLSNPGTPPNLQQVADTIRFHAWSLNNGTPWTAADAVKSVFEDAMSADLSGRAKVIINEKTIRQLPIESQILDDAGDAAIERMLAYLPGMKVWIDLSGNVIVDTENNLSGVVAQAAKIMPEIVGGGHLVTVDNSIRRPKKISVLFTREHELRFDFEELESSNMTTTVVQDQREATNVLPVPDYTLPIGGIDYCQGTWITFPQAFNSWGTVTPEFGNMDYDWILQSLVPHNGMFSIVQSYAEFNTKVDWTARLSAISQHFRQTYRINKDWMAKISTLKADRIATLDPITGNRSPAIAYCDFVSFFTQRLWADNKREDNKRNLEYARNYIGYPSGAGNSSGNAIDANSQPAPANISVVDPDLGIIRADFVVDPLRLSDIVMPGNLVETSIPTALLDNNQRGYQPVTLDSVRDGFAKSDIPQFKTKFKIAFIVTATPAAPNDTKQLYAVDVLPGEVSAEIPNIGICNGPVMQIRISPNVETARIAWSDDPADVALIEKSFGVGTSEPSSLGLKKLCVNESEDKSYAASLQNIAKAVAAQVYATMIDHPVGGATGVMNAGMAPIGWIKAVVHELTTTGELVTHIAIPDKIPEVSMFRYMDAGSRALIQREIVQNTK